MLLGQGKRLAALARKSISYFMHTGKRLQESPEPWAEGKKGVFVTIESYPKKQLRGCIGFPHAVLPLWEAVIEAAVSAAFGDPRFQQLSAGELEHITIEISVLSEPEEIMGKKEELPKKILVGRHGLIVKQGNRSGLLLPQVAAEHKMDAEKFLEACCEKAWLEKEAWKQEGCKVYCFEAQLFREKKPNGQVVEEKIAGKKC